MEMRHAPVVCPLSRALFTYRLSFGPRRSRFTFYSLTSNRPLSSRVARKSLGEEKETEFVRREIKVHTHPLLSCVKQSTLEQMCVQTHTLCFYTPTTPACQRQARGLQPWSKVILCHLFPIHQHEGLSAVSTSLQPPSCSA